jgi:hypothetical protein
MNRISLIDRSSEQSVQDGLILLILPRSDPQYPVQSISAFNKLISNMIRLNLSLSLMRMPAYPVKSTIINCASCDRPVLI